MISTRGITRIPAVTGAVVMACLAVSACKKDNEQAADTTAVAPAPAPANTTATPAAAATPTLTDPQIAHVAVTANSIDSTFGAMAKRKGQSKGVKDFGQRMMTDHGGVNKQAVQLATRLHVTPEDNDVSRSLMQSADQARGPMDGATGPMFDSLYLAREITYHQAVLDALDKVLIPQAQNADLKALLEKVRPAVAAHLESARQLQAGGGMAGMSHGDSGATKAKAP